MLESKCATTKTVLTSGLAAQPARDLLVPAHARGAPARADRARGRLRVRAARARDRHAAPLDRLRDDLERRAPVRGVAVADQRDRAAGVGGGHAELARDDVRRSPSAGVHGRFGVITAASGVGHDRARELGIAARTCAGRATPRRSSAGAPRERSTSVICRSASPLLGRKSSQPAGGRGRPCRRGTGCGRSSDRGRASGAAAAGGNVTRHRSCRWAATRPARGRGCRAGCPSRIEHRVAQREPGLRVALGYMHSRPAGLACSSLRSSQAQRAAEARVDLATTPTACRVRMMSVRSVLAVWPKRTPKRSSGVLPFRRVEERRQAVARCRRAAGQARQREHGERNDRDDAPAKGVAMAREASHSSGSERSWPATERLMRATARQASWPIVRMDVPDPSQVDAA